MPGNPAEQRPDSAACRTRGTVRHADGASGRLLDGQFNRASWPTRGLGNRVTNATGDDLLLNEGFTTHIGSRLIEKLRGVEYARIAAPARPAALEGTLDGAGRPLTRGTSSLPAANRPARCPTSPARKAPRSCSRSHRSWGRRAARRVAARILRYTRTSTDDVGGLPRVREPGAVGERETAAPA